MEKTIYWVWLTNLSGIFPNKINALLEHFETIEEIYKASFDDYKKVEGLTRGNMLVLSSKDLSRAKEIIEKSEKIGSKILTYDDVNYPDSLRRMYSPPYVLYIKGEIMKWDRLFMIGVIGTRKCSEYGEKVANFISYNLAKRGVTVVAGMARGIDSIAADAALKAGNKTIAVLGSGLDVIYPPENKKLMERIIASGAVITEYPPGSLPLAHHFPERNRIISGLSKGIVVCEAPKISGALITARYAEENGRDVFAVPGSIFSEYSVGSNNLIKTSAKAVQDALDILSEYPNEVKKLVPIEEIEDGSVNNICYVSLEDAKYSGLGDDEKKIIALLIENNMHIDDIKVKSGIDIVKLNSLMPTLEMSGFIRKLPGDNYKLEV